MNIAAGSERAVSTSSSATRAYLTALTFMLRTIIKTMICMTTKNGKKTLKRGVFGRNESTETVTSRLARRLLPASVRCFHQSFDRRRPAVKAARVRGTSA